MSSKIPLEVRDETTDGFSGGVLSTKPTDNIDDMYLSSTHTHTNGKQETKTWTSCNQGSLPGLFYLLYTIELWRAQV